MIYSMHVCPSGFFPDQLPSPSPPPEEFFFLAARLSFSPADLFLCLTIQVLSIRYVCVRLPIFPSAVMGREM